MKCKNYLKQDEVRKLIEPLNETIPQLNILSIIQMLGNEIGGDFSERVNKFIEKEKQIILNSEVKE